MTLREWQAANPEVHVQPFVSDGALQVFASRTADAGKWYLYHLSDYVVSSSASGPSLILVPRAERS